MGKGENHDGEEPTFMEQRIYHFRVIIARLL